MTTIPDDIMAAAWRPAFEAVSQVHTLEAAQVAIARAILAERERCWGVVNDERLMDADENLSDADPTDIAYDMAIDHALAAIKGA